jgi:hypothetical protein
MEVIVGMVSSSRIVAEQDRALGISRRMVACYSNGDRKAPRPILLACLGWELESQQSRAA